MYRPDKIPTGVNLELATSEELVEELLWRTDTWEETAPNHRGDTPRRVVAALKEMTTRVEFNFTTFPNTDTSREEMVVLAPIPFYTLCAHHVVPFYGDVYIGYIPDSQVAGLSKFARAVDYLAKGFWVQEELTTEIADYLQEQLEPIGVAVVIEAEHMCMSMRGVKVSGVKTTTSSMLGAYADHTKQARSEFLSLIRR
jgi:GTP cyclohydrolase I